MTEDIFFLTRENDQLLFCRDCSTAVRWPPFFAVLVSKRPLLFLCTTDALFSHTADCLSTCCCWSWAEKTRGRGGGQNTLGVATRRRGIFFGCSLSYFSQIEFHSSRAQIHISSWLLFLILRLFVLLGFCHAHREGPVVSAF